MTWCYSINIDSNIKINVIIAVLFSWLYLMPLGITINAIKEETIKTSQPLPLAVLNGIIWPLGAILLRPTAIHLGRSVQTTSELGYGQVITSHSFMRI